MHGIKKKQLSQKFNWRYSSIFFLEFTADRHESTTLMDLGKDAVLVIKLITKGECLKITGLCNGSVRSEDVCIRLLWHVRRKIIFATENGLEARIWSIPSWNCTRKYSVGCTSAWRTPVAMQELRIHGKTWIENLSLIHVNNWPYQFDGYLSKLSKILYHFLRFCSLLYQKIKRDIVFNIGWCPLFISPWIWRAIFLHLVLRQSQILQISQDFLYLYWFTRVWNRRYCLCFNFVILKKCRDTRPQHKIIKLPLALCLWNFYWWRTWTSL